MVNVIITGYVLNVLAQIYMHRTHKSKDRKFELMGGWVFCIIPYHPFIVVVLSKLGL